MSADQGAAVVEHLELDLLLEGVARAYGVDVRRAPRSDVERTVTQLQRAAGIANASALLDKVLHDREYGEHAAAVLRECAPRLFAEPAFYRAFNERVVPRLRTYPYVSVWVAECGSGSDVYSMAILLEEAGLYERTYIYATDANEACLARAMEGSLGAARIELLEDHYRASGGARSITDYLERRGEGMVVRGNLKNRIVWSEYSVGTGESFNEFGFIACRNVLSSLVPTLHRRVYKLLTESLCVFGFLALDGSEAPDVLPYKYCYKECDRDVGLYQRVC